MTATEATNVLEWERRTIQKAVATMSLTKDHLGVEQNLDPAILGDIIPVLRELSKECPR